MKKDVREKHAGRLCVLKFGSSVLRSECDYRAAAIEVYRHIRDGEKVVAVVSALANETDGLLEQAARVGGEAPKALVARLARVGELRSAALMALSLNQIGVSACTMDPHEMGLIAEGEPLDSDLCGLNDGAVLAQLFQHDAIVVPGFIASHEDHGVVTLGRGGTDLSAVFLANRLGADRVRLIKDVDGVYADDPARNRDAKRYASLGYGKAAKASNGLIQPKAIDAAHRNGLVIEIASVGAHEGTRIARFRKPQAAPPSHRPRIRVALLGCGAVGAGVLTHLKGRTDLFDLNPVLVREPARRDGEDCFTAELHEALAGQPDIVVELLGGSDYPAQIMAGALRNGAHVVTANKAALAGHYDALHAAANAGQSTLAYSGAVGGGTPILEALGRLKRQVVSIEGVMNGTCNFLLSRLSEGQPFAQALAEAQRLGFAEADPSADVDGRDAADKLALLVRHAFGAALSPEAIARQSLLAISPEAFRLAADRNEVLKQVGRCRLLADGGVAAEIAIESLPAGHSLAGARNEENRFRILTVNGAVHELHGKGAGRWPTAAAVFADIMDIQRSLLASAGTELPSMRKSA